MAQNRETRLTLGGLVTQPSKYLTEPGSLSVATNVMSRQPGQLEARIGFEDYSNSEAAGQIPRRITNTTALGINLPIIQSNAAADNQALTSSTTGILTEAAAAFSSRGAVCEMRGRVFIDANPNSIGAPFQPQLVRAIDPQSSARARRAGLIPPSWIDVAPDTGYVGGAVPAAEHVAYAAHFEREHADGYIQIGPVSPIVRTLSDGNARDMNITVYWSKIATGNDWVKIGDRVKIYRSDAATTADGINSATMYLVRVVTLASADVTASLIATTDVCEEANAGELLYTNSGQDGADDSKWFPPSAADITVFKGATWYLAPFAWRTFRLSVPGTWGTFAIGDVRRKTGIGSFQVTGTAATGVAAFTLTNIAMAEGLAVGQVVVSDGSGAWTVGTTEILSIVGTTVTMTTTSAVTGAVDFRVGDRLEIMGAEYDASSPARLMRDIALRTQSDEMNYPCWMFANFPAFRNYTSTVDGDLNNVEIVFVAPSFSYDFSTTASFVNLRATNQTHWSPALAALGATVVTLGSDDLRKNRGFFSDIDEPEAVSPLSYRLFGRGSALRFVVIDDAMLAFCTDGTYVCTGDGQTWDIRPFDLSLVLLHPRAVDTMYGEIWALTNRGVVVISGGGVQEVSTPFIGNLIRQYEETYATSLARTNGAFYVQLVCDPYHKEVWLRYMSDDVTGVTLVFNAETKTWSTVSNSTERPTALGFAANVNKLLLGQKRVAGPDYTVRRLIEDSSVVASERMPEAVVKLNPYTGADLNTRKQWLEAVWDLEILSAGQDLGVTPFFGTVEYNPYEIAAPSGEFEHVVKVPRAAAHDKKLEPGIEFSGSAEASNTAPWRLSGVTVKYRQASPDTRRQ